MSASWVLGTTQTSVKVLKTELSIEPIRADYVTFLQLEGRILQYRRLAASRKGTKCRLF
jgi:predicted transposase YdaD